MSDEVTPIPLSQFPGAWTIVNKVYLRVSKAITAIVFAAQSVYIAEHPDLSSAALAAVTAVGLAVIALLTESRAGVAEKVEQAKYVGAIEEQAMAPLRTAIAKQQAKQP